jgi:hypothetical protein
MMRTLLIRGLLAGAAAGLLTFVFAYLFGEGAVNGGIARVGSHIPRGYDG